MPLLGFGTYLLRDGSACEQSVLNAFKHWLQTDRHDDPLLPVTQRLTAHRLHRTTQCPAAVKVAVTTDTREYGHSCFGIRHDGP